MRLFFNTSTTAVFISAVVLTIVIGSSGRTHKIDTQFDVAPIEVTDNVVTTNLKKVFDVARDIGHPETLQGILLQETRAGMTEMVGNKQSPIGKRSYGLMQVQVVAARSVFERYPDVYARYFSKPYRNIVDEEVIALLLSNDEANIRIAAYHFKIYMQLVGGDWNKAVAAYNTGIGGVKNIKNTTVFPYVVAVKAHMRDTVTQFNIKHELQLTPSK